MRNLLLSAFTAIGIFFVLPLHATHIIGGELSYQYLGNDLYRITLDVYRDCSPGSAGFDNPGYINAFNEAGIQVQGNDADSFSMQPLFIETIPNNIAGDPCLFVPSGVCVERARYQTHLKLTGPGGFYIVYQRCCRNDGIANIQDELNTGATYWIYISPKAKIQQNNSPVFGFYPPVFVCVNKPINQPHAATDEDGDSLVYKFYTPYEGASFQYPQPIPGNQPPYDPDEILPPPYDTVVWESPTYTLSQILGPSTSPLSINPQTGLITGLPKIQGKFVVGVLVEEYRNGQLLSVLRRDFQYNVGECAELDVQIVAPDAQCDDLSVSFGNNTDVAQNFIWYFDWPNSTPFSTQFEPNFTFPDTGTYTVALIAEPVGECVDTAFHEIFLQYNSLTPNFAWQTFDCSAQSVLSLQDLSVDNVSPPVAWEWTVSYAGNTLTSTLQNPVFQIPNPSSGTITLVVRSQNGCEQTKTVSFFSGNNNPLDVLPQSVQICKGEPAQLNPNGPIFGFTYKWGPNVPVAQQTLVNPIVSPLQSTTYSVTITGLNGLCQSTGTVTVQVFEPVQLAFVPDTDCDARVVHFVNQSQNAPSGFAWNFGDPSTQADVSSAANPTYTYPNYGTYTVTLMTAPNAVCKDTIQQTITLEEKILSAAFTYDYTNCDEDAVTIKFFDQTANSLDNTVAWLWTFSGIYNGTATVKNPVITVSQQGQLTVTLQVTTAENCLAATVPATLNIDFTELPGIEDGSQLLGCLNGGVTLNPGGNAAYHYEWSPATGLSCSDCPSPLANPLQTTNYSVTVTNTSADTCVIERELTVMVPQNVGLVASNDVQTCSPTAALSASTSLLPVTYAWFNDAAAQVAGNVNSLTVNVSGYETYVVRATDQLGCHYFDSVQVVGGPANIEAVGDQIKCSDDVLDVSATNLDQNDTLTWVWSPEDAFSGPVNSAMPDILTVPGELWVYVDAVNQFGCQTQDSVYVAVVDVNNQLDFTYSVSCNGSTVEFVNQSTSAFNFVWEFGDPTATSDTSLLDNPTYTYPGPGTYPVVLTMDFDLDCVTPIQKDVEITATQFVVDFTYEYTDCDVDFVDVQFHDATTIFQANLDITCYHWQTSTGETSDEPSPVFTIPAGETFEVTLDICTSNGCDGTVTKDLKLEFIEVNLSDTIVLCRGDSTFLNPTGNFGYQYNWFPNTNISNPNSANPMVWPDVTTTYSVEITNLLPDTCSVSRLVTVLVPEKIEVAADEDTFTCGDPVTICASSNIGGTDFQWIAEPGGPVGNAACLTILPSSDTEYKAIGTDQYGCQDSAFVNVANESINANWQNLGTECPSINVTLSVNNMVAGHLLGYTWSATAPGQIFPPASGPTVIAATPPANQSATYSVTVTNQFGCTEVLSQNIGSYNFVPTVVGSVDVCPGVPEPLNPGADPNYNYQWSPPTGLDFANVPNPMVTVSQSTVYTVTVTNNFGPDQCQQIRQVTVNVPPIIQLEETVDTFTCGGPIVIGVQGNVPLMLEWQDEQGNVIGAGNTVQVQPQVQESYTVVATDGQGCTASDEVQVSNNQLDLLLDGNNGVIDTCPMPFYNICITNLDPNDLLDFVWTASNGGIILGDGDTACPDVTSQQGVTANFTAIVTNQWGCTDTADFDVATYVFNPLIRDVTTICPGVPTPINPEAANSTLTYLWTPQVGLDCYNCPNPSATLFQNQFYQVTILGYNGSDTCSLVQTVQVKVTPDIGLTTIPADTAICEPVDITIAANATSSIVTGMAWSNNPDLSDPFSTAGEVTVTPQATQTYYVVATDTLGCSDTASVTVYAYPISVNLDDRFNFCVEKAPLTIAVTNNDPAQELVFTWNNQDYIDEQMMDGSIIVVDIPDTIVFVANIVNQFGCTGMDSTTVYYYDIEPTIGQILASEDTILYGSGEFSQLDVDFVAGYTYQWTPETGLDDPTIHNPVATPEETTTYTVLVTDEGGCQTYREITIVVLNPDCEEPNIFLPNAFTPNGDGENDFLYVRSNIIETVELAIYNRWGQKVFETTDKNIGWNGTYKNELLTPDVYGYYLKATCFNGQAFFKKGNITLLR